ncbi:MAG: hypothetical protein ACK50J_07670, partial [Planctomyces sp.]
DPVSSNVRTTASISIGANAGVTAANIQAALNAVGVLGTGATFVTVSASGGWDIEFLLPGNIATTTIAQQPTGGTLAVSVTANGQVSSNQIQKFRLSGADSGSFILKYGKEQTAPISLQGNVPTPAGTIDAFTVAGRIKTSLELLSRLTTVNVTAWSIAAGNRTAITASGDQNADDVMFTVEFVSPDSTAGAEKMSLDATELRRRVTAGNSVSLTTVSDGQRAVSEIQKLSRLDLAKAGSSFSLTFNGATADQTTYATASIQASYDQVTPSVGFAQVNASDANNWFVTFTGAPGADQALSGMITTNSSQLAQEIPLSDL